MIAGLMTRGKSGHYRAGC